MILSLVFAAVLAAAPPTQTGVYLSAVSNYSEGHVDAAVSALASLSHEAVRRETEMMVRDAARTPADRRTRDLERRLEAAAMLHTDYAIRADLDPEGTFFHIDMAHLLLSFDRDMLTRPDPDHVRRQQFVTRWSAVAAGVLLYDGLDKDASPIVDEALKLAPSSTKLLFWRGLILEFQAVWAREPGRDPHAGLLAGSNRGARSDMVTDSRLWRPVEEAYRRVIQLDPRAYEAHLHLGYTLYWQERFADARAEYELARDQARDPFVIYLADLLLARLDEHQKTMDAAAADYERALAAVPTAQSAYIGLGALELRRGNIEAARRLTTRLVAIPESAGADDPWWAYHGARRSSADLAWLRAAVHR